MSRSLSDIISSVPIANRWKLDQEIDFEHRDIRGRVVPQHLGIIAESMVDWEGAIADLLGLTEADRSDIKDGNPQKPKLQRREVLSKWKSRLGSAATYRALVEVFIKAGKADYADAVCYLFKDADVGSDLGVGSSTPTTVSHAQTTGNIGAGHIDFSQSMGPDSLGKWLMQEYGRDYLEDVEKLNKAKINGKQLLNNLSTLISRLDLSVGFQMEIEERVKQLKENGGSAGATLPSGGVASLPPARTPPPSNAERPPQQPNDALDHKSLYSQLKVHAQKWREIGTHLGFRQPELSEIQARPALFMDAPGSWLRAMLEDWLEWKPGDERGSATLENLKSAVSKAGLGRTAAELRK